VPSEERYTVSSLIVLTAVIIIYVRLNELWSSVDDHMNTLR